MARFITLILSTLIPLAVQAQEAIRFTPAEWDFGSILETDGRVSHTFTGQNVGKEPLVILDVVTTCGCTVPEFSKQPLLPGQKTEITVSYDPANRPGIFNKELWVYSSERKRIATLRIRGNVTPRVKSTEELFPIDAGGGLGLASTLCAFAYLYPGQVKQSAIGCANLSTRPIRLELRPEAASGLLRVEYPRQLDPGQRAQIDLAYAMSADNPRYGTLRDALEVVVDGRSRGTMIVAHGIWVDAPPAPGADSRLAKAEFSENFIKFGPIRSNDGLHRRYFTLANTGRADLNVRAVECEGGVGVSLSPGRRIAPGDAVRVEVSLNPAQHPYGVLSTHLVIVTNDPERPMRRIRVTAIIED